MGGAAVALENGYMKEALVSSLAKRSHDIESGDKKIIGVNVFQETEQSPLSVDESIQKVSDKVVSDKINSLFKYKEKRDEKRLKQV